ncbi:tetratricopeptide repeat protein [Helicobacter cappadocius]|uniref:beta-lactamase n=1 Tax=Helicobacter cappadocius TaxID=3063998 RepID=A0AA90PJ76_9HELI|nr:MULTISPECIES: tetratricopeptide repeat protein [unclassified Helicobacter]MDO7253318.1 tetratricopeptide repeat protein [Helicobacter sp. faydin-H75]MDP2539252.1 tetratricopeptide repeat protein [Helicobacter sp. faydin-H76]
MNTYFDSAKKAYKNQDYKTCISHCIEILSQDERDFKAWKLCAFCLWEIGENLKAIEYLEHSLCIFEDDILAWVSLAEMYRKTHQPQKSIEILSRFIPSACADLYFNLARAYTDIENFSQAIKYYKEVLIISPNDVEAMYNLGNQFLRIKDIKNAKEIFEKASDLGHKDSKINLASIYCDMFEEQKALEIYRSLKKSTSENAHFYFNYANALKYALNFRESKKMYKKAISMTIDPAFLVNYAYLILSLGEYQEGFMSYQGRLLFENILPMGVDKKRVLLPFDREIGQKNILIYHEQGFGDTLMFSRFIDKLISLGKNVQILPQPELVSLFCDRWGERVKKHHREITSYDIAFSIPSLPYVLGEGLFELNLCNKVSPLCLKEINKIGVFFTSVSNSKDSMQRSIPPEKLLECLKRFEIYSLQPEGTAINVCKKFDAIDLSSKITDFKSTLKYLKKLDLLITIDSAIAHLAGSYGIPTIVLLPKRYDWRWGKLGQSNFKDGLFVGVRSNWYHCVIGIAQEENGDWNKVLEILKNFLNGAYNV